jgi:hypothetical protein
MENGKHTTVDWIHLSLEPSWGIQLNDQPDGIRWFWTENGAYSSKSAYLEQFKGPYYSFRAKSVWKAHAEGKHNLFAWLFIQTKIFKADKLLLRDWPCNPVCVLCDQNLETALHLCIKCPFGLEVWEKVRSWMKNLVVPPSPNTQNIDLWWDSALHSRSKEEHLTIANLLMYFTWKFGRKEISTSLTTNRLRLQQFFRWHTMRWLWGELQLGIHVYLNGMFVCWCCVWVYPFM